MADNLKSITVYYYAVLREKRGIAQETVMTQAATAAALYEELNEQYHFPIARDLLKAAVNDEYCDWDSPIHAGDSVIFIPPVAGG